VLTAEPATYSIFDTATFSFTDAQSGVSFQCSLDGASFTLCVSGVSYSGLAPVGNSWNILYIRHSFTVKAIDGSGNASAATNWSWTVGNQNMSGAAVNFGALAVSQTSAAQTITLYAPTAATISKVIASTQGTTGMDFAITDPGTCAVGTALAA
jgi:hypothetical protein